MPHFALEAGVRVSRSATARLRFHSLNLFGELGELKERSNTDDFFAEFVDSGVGKDDSVERFLLFPRSCSIPGFFLGLEPSVFVFGPWLC